MSSELDAIVLREVCTKAGCRRENLTTTQISSNGSVETETIQKFLSICLNQYFVCSKTDTTESSPDSEVPKVSKNPWFCLLIP